MTIRSDKCLTFGSEYDLQILKKWLCQSEMN
jgi:hypothetical protein